MESVKIIYKEIGKEATDCLKKEVEDLLLLKGRETIWIECDSMPALEYAASRESDAVVLWQEGGGQGEPCKAWDIAAVRDGAKIRIVPCVKRLHYGTSFMAVLYAGGIVDALFEDEADAVHIVERLLTKRSRKECRVYYGIRSLQEVVSVLQIMEQDTLERYLQYIGGGIDGEEMQMRFREVARKLSYMEQCFLLEKLPSNVQEAIRTDAGPGSFCSIHQTAGKRKRPYLARK